MLKLINNNNFNQKVFDINVFKNVKTKYP
jgi:hypothetical protein